MAPKRSRLTPKKRRESGFVSSKGAATKADNHADLENGGPTANNVWMLGDLVWSKVSGHPWWPSMIAYPPDQACYFKELGSKSKKYHVQFFGETALRGWVNGKDTFAFQGKANYIKNTIVPNAKKLPPNKYVKLWEAALRYAEEALRLERKTRIVEYAFIYNHEKKEDNKQSSSIVNGKSKGKAKPNRESNLEKSVNNKNIGLDENGNCDYANQQPGKRKRKQKIDNAFHSGKEFDNAFRKKRKQDENCVSKNGNHLSNDVSQAGKSKQGSTINTKQSRSSKLSCNETDAGEKEVSPPEQSKVSRDGVCIVCEEKGNVIQCQGGCFNFYHTSCLGLSFEVTMHGTFKCDECQSDNHSCFRCKESGEVRKCNHARCGKYYHEKCLIFTGQDDHKRDANNEGKGHCSIHICSYCNNAKDKYLGKSKLISCIRCPTSYHSSTCLVAGSTQLSSSSMICEKHFVSDKTKAHHMAIHVNWCFGCLEGGTLVCCDSCPVAFHAGCIEDFDDATANKWQCIGCREGRKPLYTDIVWVKFGCWRWWPAKVCFPDDVPEHIMRLDHQLGEFPVMFFGSHDYCWLNRNRVFFYEDGDKGSQRATSNTLKSHFKNALVEAKQEFAALKEKRKQQQESLMAKHPPPYKHIKCNRYVSATRSILDAASLPVCECSTADENPCGPRSNCLNRMMQCACYSKTCPAKDKCQNQFFQKNIYVDSQPVKSASCGWGLKSKYAVNKGCFVIEYQGELINEETCKARIQSYHDDGVSDYYFLVIDRDCIIDAYPKGNLSRFMNHSCDPNCETQKWTVNGEIRVGLFATRDISLGEELTFNYNLDCLGNQKKQCKCGTDNCSGYLGARPKTLSSTIDKKKDKKKKKKKKAKVKARHEDDCFICGDGGELILCDLKSCSKCYHTACLSLNQQPKGQWHCPWHFCDMCGKRATVLCQLCPNSYCNQHSKGEIDVLPTVVACTEHGKDEIKEFCAENKVNKDRRILSKNGNNGQSEE